MTETTTTSEATTAAPFKPKKSVALSGVAAGNTALCTVGRTGNDLHYRGYDILELADAAEFEEIAYLLVHGKLPNAAELAAYKKKLKGLRGIPAAVQGVLERIPASAHPMDVMRTACSALGTVLPEGQDHKLAEARDNLVTNDDDGADRHLAGGEPEASLLERRVHVVVVRHAGRL